MRYFVATLGIVLTISLCWMLDGIHFKGVPLAFGRVLDPFHGFWQNMEGKEIDWEKDLNVTGLEGKVQVVYDSLRIPHIFAENSHDLFFMQGYVTARDRLWQMEFQTFAAAGRLSELISDPRVFALDRARRRTGMVYAAEQSMHAMEADPVSNAIIHAYTDGVNAYINSLSYAEYPLEYKLLNYAPEQWTTLKCGLLLKLMAWDLTGRTEDFENTNAVIEMGWPAYKKLYPGYSKDNSPIAPSGTAWNFDTLKVQAPQNYQPNAIASHLNYPQPDPMNGSNNWVVGKSKTANGNPILCNDPHLSLRLPSIWYEIQLSMPGYNSYGVSLPGSPAVIIGFNSDVSWGVTNASRDVLDWYNIEFQDETRMTYKHNGQWMPTKQRLEVIKQRFGPDFTDTIVFTQHGPVVYDRNYSDPDSSGPINMAMRWAGHDSTNELLTFYKLNIAKNHDDYREAIRSYACPGQNFIFASKTGDIAVTQQGRFPVKWDGQGQFIMDGNEPLHLWQAYIPAEQNPYSRNPDRDYLFSANQFAADTTYPYNIDGYYDYTRNQRINSALAGMNGIKMEDMFRLQTDNYNVLAQIALPKLLTVVDRTGLSPDALEALETLTSWNYMNDYEKTAPSIFKVWKEHLYNLIWADDMQQIGRKAELPESFFTMVWIADTTEFKAIDDQRTPQVEDLKFMATKSFKEAMEELQAFKSENGDYTWQRFNNVQVVHLTRQKAFSFYELPTGGDAGIVNANHANVGASWRMVVELGAEPNAYGVFPGGESGNPASPFYSNSIPVWAAGQYHKLEYLKSADEKNPAVIFSQTFQGK